ncbi:MAG: sigma-54-dependent transcriptional regulator [Phycisphaerales bacterium]
MKRILIVDDKEMMRDSVATTLTRRGYAVTAASNGQAALDQLGKRSVDAVVTDLSMPGMDGRQLLAEIRRIDDSIPVILMTAYGSIETAVGAMRDGAWDYITKPFGGDELIVAVDRAVEHRRIRRENQVLKATQTAPSQPGRDHEMVGGGHAMSELRTELEPIASSQGTVLITGESGTGKEVTARWIHEHSARRDAPFLAINCAALSTNLLESELFGHEKGAFTGADKMRQGRFELADGGTLLLDEISEVSPTIQAKLLRVLQEKSFERVGGSRQLSVDVRVIATSNRDLPAAVRTGAFREDLFYRLNVLPLGLPPLRSRPEDVESLTTHFLGQVASREGGSAKTFDEVALDALRAYHWPGNVRELQNICERAAVLAPERTIRASLIMPWLRCAPGSAIGATATSTIETKPGGAEPEAGAHPITAGIVCDGGLTLGTIEREIIINTLKHFSGHRRRSAAALGIGVRTLGLKIKKWKEEAIIDAAL